MANCDLYRANDQIRQGRKGIDVSPSPLTGFQSRAKHCCLGLLCKARMQFAQPKINRQLHQLRPASGLYCRWPVCSYEQQAQQYEVYSA
jgi:hypothetical protein